MRHVQHTEPTPTESVAQGQQASRDRGDVPGWVLITLMSAGLVVVLWQLAGDQLTAVFEQAIARVTAM